jgi:oligopeptide/dipeptide ABC transporter ATP-binding protein
MGTDIPLVELRDLRISTDDGVSLVRGLDLRADRGEIVAIVGESGSGKTLTMLSLLDAVPYGLASSWSMRRGGRAAEPTAPRYAYIAADPGSVMNPLRTVRDQLTDGWGRASRRDEKARVEQVLTSVGLTDAARVAASRPDQLSGGMRQRALIAIAVASEPDVLVADEPTTALDVSLQAQVLRLLVDIRDRTGCTVFIVTHDMTTVSEVCDRVYVMYAGEVVEHGTVAEVCGDPRHPYTRALIDSIPKLGGEPPARLETVPGIPPAPAAVGPGCAFADRCTLRQALGSPAACITEHPPLRADGGRTARCHFAEA